MIINSLKRIENIFHFLKILIFEFENESIFFIQNITRMKLIFFNPNFCLTTLLLLLIYSTTSCIDNNAKVKENDGNFASDKNAKKSVKEVILVDNGAVVPVPTVRRLVMSFKNSDNILFTYIEKTGTYVSENQNNILIDKDNREVIRDEIERIAEMAEDGLDVNPGKQLCVGMNSLNVEVIFNTGDTSRFEVSGTARCDRTLCPSVWNLDSIAMVVFHNYKSRL